MSYDGKIGEIRDIVESMTLSKVKSFYPESIQKAINLPLDEIVEKLEVLRHKEIVRLRFEVRCPNDYSVVESVDDFRTIEGNIVECYKCGDSFEVTFQYIYPKYFITAEYCEYLKKKYQRKQVNKQEILM